MQYIRIGKDSDIAMHRINNKQKINNVEQVSMLDAIFCVEMF